MATREITDCLSTVGAIQIDSLLINSYDNALTLVNICVSLHAAAASIFNICQFITLTLSYLTYTTDPPSLVLITHDN